ncbi:MAG: Maf family protein [Balneolaceae bacterium]
MRHLILASKSPRRKKLFTQIGLRCTFFDSGIEETFSNHLPPSEIVESLAGQKAEASAPHFDDALIVAADTIVVLGGEILGKPADADQAKEMLGRLSGRTHRVYTGVCLIKTGRKGKITDRMEFHEETKVTFAPLSEREISFYVQGGSPLDKAGAYGIQDDFGSVFVSKIEGDYYNVVGFPLHRFYYHMKTFDPGSLHGLYL